MPSRKNQPSKTRKEELPHRLIRLGLIPSHRNANRPLLSPETYDMLIYNIDTHTIQYASPNGWHDVDDSTEQEP